MYNKDDYDLAGFCVGIVDQSDLIDGTSISTGDAIIGIASSGPHSNGYSLIRKVLDIADNLDLEGESVNDLLLKPTKIYVKSIMRLMSKIKIKGMAHITGGGLSENIPRILNSDIHATININSWQQPSIFDWLSNTGNISTEEMRRTFNCGIGMALVINQKEVNMALELLNSYDEVAWDIGKISPGKGMVEYI